VLDRVNVRVKQGQPLRRLTLDLHVVVTGLVSLSPYFTHIFCHFRSKRAFCSVAESVKEGCLVPGNPKLLMTFKPAVFTWPGNTFGFLIKTNKESLNMSFNDIIAIFLISNFCSVLNVVFFFLGDYPMSELYEPTFRKTVPSSKAV
jgi:hypothetical protein